jgi:hypothetical protein
MLAKGGWRQHLIGGASVRVIRGKKSSRGRAHNQFTVYLYEENTQYLLSILLFAVSFVLS